MALPVTAVTERAGRYERQPAGYRAFMPCPLPPNPPLVMDTALTRLLSRADRALAGLDAAIHTLPNPDLFLAMYVRKEAVLSSQIEGTQSSLNDLLRADARLTGADIPDDVSEVSNYVRAMNHGLARLPDLPVSARLIREIHAELMQGVRGGDRHPGEFRRSQVWIAPAGATIQEATFVPPPWQEVEPAVASLERYIHLPEEDTDPPLVRVALAHAQFETIHPFNDGNGRMGRLLITLLLIQLNILSRPVLYLSTFFKAHRQEYYENLQAIRDRGAWEEWIDFFLTGVAEVAGQAHTVARSIVALREDHWKLIAEKFGSRAGQAITVLEGLFRSPIVSVNAVRDRLNVSYPHANRIIRELVDAGILTEITGRERNRNFLYAPYVDLFADL